MYKKFKVLMITVISIILILFIVTILLYRLPISYEPVTISGEIKYKFLNFDFSYRGITEDLLFKSKIVYLVNGEHLFVSQEDHSKLWEVNPHKMKKLGYTIQAEFEVKKVLIGEYGLAKLVRFETINKLPVIAK